MFLPAALCFAVRLGVENTSFIVMSSSLKNKGWDQLTAVLNFTFSTDLKRIQTPCSLFRGFGADRTFTTRRSWNLSRRPFLLISSTCRQFRFAALHRIWCKHADLFLFLVFTQRPWMIARLSEAISTDLDYHNFCKFQVWVQVQAAAGHMACTPQGYSRRKSKASQ